jgi:hypothetical protein
MTVVTRRRRYSSQSPGMQLLLVTMPWLSWRRTRRRVLTRDGHRCRVCGSARDLEVYYVHPGPAYYWEGLIAVCGPCHSRQLWAQMEEDRRLEEQAATARRENRSYYRREMAVPRRRGKLDVSDLKRRTA